MRIEELFTKFPRKGCWHLEGHPEPFLQKVIRELLKNQGVAVKQFDLDAKKNLSEGMLDALRSTDLFSPSVALWLREPPPHSQWKSEHKRIFSDLCALANGTETFLIVETKPDRRKKNPFSDFLKIEWTGALSEKMFFLKRLNAATEPKLGEKALEFLCTLDADLSELENDIELWKLGGEKWAEATFQGRSPAKDTQTNPAFAWVDAVLWKKKSEALSWLKRLQDEGAEPLQLIGLLAKSAKILAKIEMGRKPDGEAPFLVEKLGKVARRGKQAEELVRNLAEMDQKFKTVPVAQWASLALLG